MLRPTSSKLVVSIVLLRVSSSLYSRESPPIALSLFDPESAEEFAQVSIALVTQVQEPFSPEQVELYNEPNDDPLLILRNDIPAIARAEWGECVQQYFSDLIGRTTRFRLPPAMELMLTAEPLSAVNYLDLLYRILPCDQEESVCKYSRVCRYYEVLTELEARSVARVTGTDLRAFPPRRIRVTGSDGRVENVYVLLGNVKSEGGVYVYPGISLSGKNISVRKLGSGAQTRMDRERAVLTALQGVAGVPQLLRLAVESENAGIDDSVLITKTPFASSVQLSRVHKSSWSFVTAVAKRGLEVLKGIHESGFIVRRISAETLFVDWLTKRAENLHFRDLKYAMPWKTNEFHWRALGDTLPPSARAIFELQGHQPSRRDDLYQFNEVLLRMLGEPAFLHDDRLESEKDASVTLAMKMDRKLESIRAIPCAFVVFFEDVKNLDANDDPPYDKWIESFSERNTSKTCF